MGEVSEVERREELKVVAEVALVQGHQGLGQGQSRAQSPDQGQGLARNLDPESPDQGQPADRDPGGLEVDPRGLDLDRPSQAAAQGLALAVRQGRGPRVDQGQEVQQNQGRAVQPNQGQEVQQSQGREVQGNQGPEVQQQGQGPQAHQGQGQGLPEAIEINHQFNAQTMCCYCLYRVDSSAPISSVKSYFWLSCKP